MELSQETYRASEFGLTDKEKKQREEFFKQYKERKGNSSVKRRCDE